MTDEAFDLYMLFIDLIVQKETMPHDEWRRRITKIAYRIEGKRQITLFEVEAQGWMS